MEIQLLHGVKAAREDLYLEELDDAESSIAEARAAAQKAMAPSDIRERLEAAEDKARQAVRKQKAAEEKYEDNLNRILEREDLYDRHITRFLATMKRTGEKMEDELRKANATIKELKVEATPALIVRQMALNVEAHLVQQCKTRFGSDPRLTALDVDGIFPEITDMPTLCGFIESIISRDANLLQDMQAFLAATAHMSDYNAMKDAFINAKQEGTGVCHQECNAMLQLMRQEGVLDDFIRIHGSAEAKMIYSKLYKELPQA
jgi:hypothetical protein